MHTDQDTIVAISTPPGRGGIGVVRLSGTAARQIALPLLRLRSPLAHGRARFAQILDQHLDPEGDSSTSVSPAILDHAIATFFAAPRSYTSEDTVEISCHGAPVLLDFLVRACIRRGARLAEPGEFTQRAFLAGRLDLTQAEAVHDLIQSSTLHQARLASAQLGGAVSRAVAPSKHDLLHLIAELEAGVDFAEDDIDVLPTSAITGRIGLLLGPLHRLAESYTYGRVVREGFTLAIVGRPNAGKSSLFNRLLARDRAIVTDQPGTTRDSIAETLAIEGIPVQLVDTAGIRTAPPGREGEAERAGVARTASTIAEADLILHVLDATALLESASLRASHATALSQAPSGDEAGTLQLLQGRPHLVVVNKADMLAGAPFPQPSEAPEFLFVSARTGQGIDQLQKAIVRSLTGNASPPESAPLTNLRQQQAVSQAIAALQAGSKATAAHLPHELLLLDLYAALHALDELTGASSPDDILNLIFRSFCIGK